MENSRNKNNPFVGQENRTSKGINKSFIFQLKLMRRWTRFLKRKKCCQWLHQYYRRLYLGILTGKVIAIYDDDDDDDDEAASSQG